MLYCLKKEYFFLNKRTIHLQNGFHLVLYNSWYALSQLAFLLQDVLPRGRLLQSPSDCCSQQSPDVSRFSKFSLATNYLMLQEEMRLLYHGECYPVWIWWFFWKFHVVSCDELNKGNRLWLFVYSRTLSGNNAVFRYKQEMSLELSFKKLWLRTLLWCSSYLVFFFFNDHIMFLLVHTEHGVDLGEIPPPLFHLFK